MAKKMSFSAGMSSSTKVLNNTNVNSLVNNNIDTGYNFKFIDINDIKPNKLNSDFPQEDIDSLRYSIMVNGLLHALVVIKNGDGTYRLISGERRYHALSSMEPDMLKEMFPQGIPCKLDSIKGGDEVDEKIRIFSANLDARDYEPGEKSKLIRELLKLYEIKEKRGEIPSAIQAIMEAYNIRERMAKRYAAANRTIPELQKILDDGSISLKEAEKFSAFSEETQKQIAELILNNGKVESVDIEVLKKMEEENKKLEKEALKTAKELEEKTKAVTVLEKQLKEMEKEAKELAKKEKDAPSKKDTSEQEELLEKMEWYKQQYEKESKERKRAQSNLERLQQEAKEKKARNLQQVSQEELKKAADYAKAEGIQDNMFRQLKELEKIQDTIKQDETLQVQFKVIYDRLGDMLK